MNRTRFRIAGGTIMVLLLLYLIPYVKEISGISPASLMSDEEATNAWLRSNGMALFSTVINLAFSLIMAIVLAPIKLNSMLSKVLIILLVPVLLGNVSGAFIWKMLLSDGAFFHRSWLHNYLTLSFIQFWQYGTLYTYLFWLGIQNIPKTTLDYAFSSQLSFWERARDILLPSFKNLTIILVIVNFIFTYFDYAKIQFIFKGAPGTSNEFISQWLSRDFLSTSLISPDLAVAESASKSLWILVSGFIVVAVVVFVSQFLLKRLLISRTNVRLPKFPDLSTLCAYLCVFLVVSPLVLTFIYTAPDFKLDFGVLLQPICLTLLASIVALLVSIVLGISMRLGWPKTMATFNTRSLMVIIILFGILLIPPISLYITGFQWLRLLGYSNKVSVYLVWIFGHTLLILPILGSFMIVTHFRTRNIELNYLKAHHVGWTIIVRDSFLLRFKADYLLAFLIGFSFIWNESIINNLLSDFIPSFVSNLKMNIEGRAADYAKGLNYLLISIVIATLSAMVWNLILAKSKSTGNEIH